MHNLPKTIDLATQDTPIELNLNELNSNLELKNQIITILEQNNFKESYNYIEELKCAWEKSALKDEIKVIEDYDRCLKEKCGFKEKHLTDFTSKAILSKKSVILNYEALKENSYNHVEIIRLVNSSGGCSKLVALKEKHPLLIQLGFTKEQILALALLPEGSLKLDLAVLTTPWMKSEAFLNEHILRLLSGAPQAKERVKFLVINYDKIKKNPALIISNKDEIIRFCIQQTNIELKHIKKTKDKTQPEKKKKKRPIQVASASNSNKKSCIVYIDSSPVNIELPTPAFPEKTEHSSEHLLVESATQALHNSENSVQNNISLEVGASYPVNYFLPVNYSDFGIFWGPLLYFSQMPEEQTNSLQTFAPDDLFNGPFSSNGVSALHPDEVNFYPLQGFSEQNNYPGNDAPPLINYSSDNLSPPSSSSSFNEVHPIQQNHLISASSTSVAAPLPFSSNSLSFFNENVVELDQINTMPLPPNVRW